MAILSVSVSGFAVGYLIILLILGKYASLHLSALTILQPCSIGIGVPHNFLMVMILPLIGCVILKGFVLNIGTDCISS